MFLFLAERATIIHGTAAKSHYLSAFLAKNSVKPDASAINKYKYVLEVEDAMRVLP